MSLPFDLTALASVLQLVGAFLGIYLLAIWISLLIWTLRDVRARSRDLFVQILSVLLVFVFNLPGLLLYFMLRPRETLAEQNERELAQEALMQDIEEKLACPVCSQKVHADFLFCPNCHTRLKRRCDNCHRITSLRWNICPYCGAPASAPPPTTNPQ